MRLTPCDLQRNMAQFCRTGQDPSNVGMSQSRARIYRGLVFSTVQSTLLNYYPVSYRLLGPEAWEALTTAFFSEYPCSSPQFWKMPKGLAEYVRASYWGEKKGMPYLADLLDFEWLEMDVFMMPDQQIASYSLDGDVLEDCLYINPEHRIQTYSYPVFKRIDTSAEIKQGVFPVFCYRHPETLAVHFFSLSKFFQSVVEDLKQRAHSGREALCEAARECGIPENERLIQVGRAFFDDLMKKRAILGFIR